MKVSHKMKMKLSEALKLAIKAIDAGKAEVARGILQEDLLPTIEKEEQPGGILGDPVFEEDHEFEGPTVGSSETGKGWKELRGPNTKCVICGRLLKEHSGTDK